MGSLGKILGTWEPVIGLEDQTLSWDEKPQRAVVLRTKEEEHDYRYFPDPEVVRSLLTEALERNHRR